MTGDEFAAVMRTEVLPSIRRVVKAWPRVFPRGMADVKLCMDHAPWHKKAIRDGLLKAMGLQDSQLVPHPASSPDFQAPVEWSHGWLNKATRQYLEEHPRVRSPEKIRRTMQELFYGTIRVAQEPAVTAGKVARAFSRLMQNYASIINTKGDYGMKDAT